jgi:hypothetical protein
MPADIVKENHVVQPSVQPCICQGCIYLNAGEIRFCKTFPEIPDTTLTTKETQGFKLYSTLSFPEILGLENAKREQAAISYAF